MLWANCTDAYRRYHLSGCSVEQLGHFYLSLSCFCSNFCFKSRPTNTHTFTQTNPNKKGGAALSSHQGLLLHHFIVTDPLPIFFPITSAALSFDTESKVSLFTPIAVELQVQSSNHHQFSTMRDHWVLQGSRALPSCALTSLPQTSDPSDSKSEVVTPQQTH